MALLCIINDNRYNFINYCKKGRGGINAAPPFFDEKIFLPLKN